MNSLAFFTIAAVVGYHTSHATCPVPEKLVTDVQNCLDDMMTFVRAPEKERLSKCPYLQQGVNCIDEILEACKDNESLQGQYDMLKERMAKSRQDFAAFCGSSMEAHSNGRSAEGNTNGVRGTLVSGTWIAALAVLMTIYII